METVIRRNLIIGLMILFVGAFVVPGVARGDTIYVDDDNTSGPWDGTLEHPYQHIQDGIDNASASDTVFVFNGTYYENVGVNKTLSLMGEDKDSTVIDGGGSEDEDVVWIRGAHSVNITGFTMQNSGHSRKDAGIYIRSSNNTVSGNIIRDNHYGIYIFDSSGNVISENTLKDNYYGISDAPVGFWGILVGSSGNKFYHNNLFSNTLSARGWTDDEWDDGYPSGGNYWSDYGGMDEDSDGIGDTPYDLYWWSGQDRYPLMYPWDYSTVFVDDDAEPSWYDSIHVSTIQEGIDSATESGGVYVYNGTYYENVTVGKRVHLIGQTMDSVFVDGNGSGDVISISADLVSIRGFTMQNSGSGSGIAVWSDYNTIFANNIADNGYGIYIYSSDSSRIYNNNFINNTQSAYDEYNNQWWDYYPSCGNYWSDFDEPSEGAYDENGDGLVDSVYNIPGGSNQDRLPFINPWDGTPPGPPLCGDANGDGIVDIGDIVYLLNYLYINGPDPWPALCVGDCNCDEAVDSGDIVFLLGYLYAGASGPGGCCGT